MFRGAVGCQFLGLVSCGRRAVAAGNHSDLDAKALSIAGMPTTQFKPIQSIRSSE